MYIALLCLQERIVVPEHIVLLNGPPGSGKQVNLPSIQSALGIQRHVEMSALLKADPTAQRDMDRGSLVPDAHSCIALLHGVLSPAHANKDPAGVIIDGFPRSGIQVRICATVTF